MSASIRCVAVTIAVGAVAGLGILAWRHETWIDATVERAERELASSRSGSANARAACDLLVGLDALAADCFGDQDSIGAPWTWQPAFDSGLRRQLSTFDPYFAAIDAVCASPVVRCALERRERIDHPTSLLWSRARTNVLCAKAVLAARDGDDEEAASRLGQALDLIRLDFDPDRCEMLIQVALNDIALRGVRAASAESRADATYWESRLASRIALGSHPASVIECMLGETLWLLSVDDWDALAPDAGPIERWKIRDAAARALEALHDGTWTPGFGGGPWLDTLPALADVEAVQRRRFGQARMALSLASKRPDGAWPSRLEGLANGNTLDDEDAASISWVVDGDEASLLVCVDEERGTVESWPLR